MKFKFKIQEYQTDAVDAVVKVFNGQPHYDKISYIRDLGKPQHNQQIALHIDDDDIDLQSETGYKNESIELTDTQLLDNIRAIQSENNIKVSDKLIADVGRCSLDIEMETGTGKTYVYIKTMFELNKRYGWSKFIVVVPSIAIREGVNKTFQITADHFMEQYGNAVLLRTWIMQTRCAFMQSCHADSIFPLLLVTILPTGRLPLTREW